MSSEKPIEIERPAITISPVTSEDGFKLCQQILIEVWDLENEGHRNIIPTRLFQVSHSYGGIVLGAYLPEGSIIGFAWAFPALDSQRNVFLFSDTLAVLPQYRDRGIGTRLKFEQREWALRHDLSIIRWTYDPLEARNSYLNLARLGGVAMTYKRNAYGVGLTGPNKGLETDRLVVNWFINSPRVRKRASVRYTPEAPPAYPSCIKLQDSGDDVIPAEALLDRCQSNLLIPIPLDFQRLKETYFDAAQRWRLAMREVCETYFSRGYAMVDFYVSLLNGKRYGYYRLARDWHESLA